jgi:hypothetical protein
MPTVQDDVQRIDACQDVIEYMQNALKSLEEGRDNDFWIACHQAFETLVALVSEDFAP